MKDDQGVSIIETPTEFETRAHLKFKDDSLLSRALTHRSYLNEYTDALEDNERLEFLGDAVLDFIVGAWLYNRFPEMNEGEMTRLRAALVRTEKLADFARELDMGPALRLGKGEDEGGGRDRDAMLCACFEALTGALYLDQGIVAVEEFTAPFLEKGVDYILENHYDKDAKSVLQEWAQGQGHSPPNYRIIAEDGPDHQKTFEVEVFVNDEAMGSGSGHSKQSASKKAASVALNKLNL